MLDVTPEELANALQALVCAVEYPKDNAYLGPLRQEKICTAHDVLKRYHESKHGRS